jgi:hypothetical protein
MPKFDEKALEEATGGAAMKSAPAKDEVEVQRLTNVYNIPKSWLQIITEKRHSTYSGYIRSAIQEKLEREGLI